MGSAGKPVINIEIFSDLACPWCYVGKRRLDKAVQRIQDRAAVDVTWRAYIIDPKTKLRGEEYLAYNRRRWGGDEWTQQLRASGKPDGALFSNWKWWPNTLQAHRLVQHAQRHGKGSEAKEALFVEQYERGGNISDDVTLVRVGEEELGLPGVVALLESDDGIAEVLAEDTRAKNELAIHGVPYFIIGGAGGGGGKRYALNGAQSAEAFERVFDKVLAEEGAAA